MPCWEVIKVLGCTMGAFLAAVKASGIRGRLVRGCRLWSPAEVEAIRPLVVAHAGA